MNHQVSGNLKKNNNRVLDKEGTKPVKSEIRVEFYKTTERLLSTYSMANKSIRTAQGKI